jgi:3-oxoacyl-[acyl-carrier-protein] synthase III
LFATPPSTGKSSSTTPATTKVVKPPRKTKKQLKLEAEQNGENMTPIARKRQSNGKRETAKEKKSRMETTNLKSNGQQVVKASPTIVPRKIYELTENESIAVSVLAGLANGRFS